MKPATIRDVAKKAGVGLGTVSRVINESPKVSEATRLRVLQAIRELNYVPNPTARRLSMGKTLVIAVIVPFFTRPAQLERLRGIENTLVESDYDLIIYNIETVQRRDACIQELPRKERADGVILISLSPRNEDLPYLVHTDIPIVLVDANHPSLNMLNRVIVEDVQGGRMATQHLIDLGHKRIGYISDFLDNPFNFTSSRDRYNGYRQALTAAGITFQPELHRQGEHGRYEAYCLALEVLALPQPPTAIFAASDTQAMGVLQAARELGLHIPQDLSVIGYDDIEVAEYLGLTTMRQRLYDSGQRGVELLLEILHNPNAKPKCEVMPTELIIRETTAPPK
ncbi:MAG: LacI family DNA-binding transcriptional regulator [Anaerolineales bacterium]